MWASVRLAEASSREGERSAFERFVRAQAGVMSALVVRVTGRADAPTRVLPPAFREAAENGVASEGGVRRIVMRRALADIRKRNRGCETAIDALMPCFDAAGAFFEPPLPWRAERLDAFEDQRGIRELIERLPDPYRGALLVRDGEGIPEHEAAEILEIPRGDLRVTLQRARLALRTLVDEQLHAETCTEERTASR